MERVHKAAVTFHVPVFAVEGTERVHRTGEAVDTGVVVLVAGASTLSSLLSSTLSSLFLATGSVIRTSRHVGERTKIVVEGMVLLHHDDDVIEFAEISFGARTARTQSQRAKHAACNEKRPVLH